jgi:hypothetical protein
MARRERDGNFATTNDFGSKPWAGTPGGCNPRAFADDVPMQLNAAQAHFLRQILTNTRIITAALINGVIVFLIVVIFVMKGEAKPAPQVHTYLSFAIGIAALVLSRIIPNLVGRSIERALIEGKQVALPPQLKTPAEVGIVGNLAFLFQTRMIVGLAILEGAAFYNVLAYMLERQQISLVMVGLLLAAMLLKFPTRGGLESWLAAEMKSLDELRSLGPRQSR